MYRITVFVVSLILLLSCKKGQLSPVGLNGTYSGQFSVRNNPLANNMTEGAHNVTIVFKGDNYSSTANADNMPGRGTGNLYNTV